MGYSSDTGWSEDVTSLSNALNAFVGKTVASWEFVDKPWGGDEPWPGEGVRLVMSDGTKLTVYEHGQAGQIKYKIGGA